VTEIGESAFESCKSLTSVVIPSSVTQIGERAFKGCSIRSLNHPRLKITDGLAISGKTLLYCSVQDANVVIPSSVTRIGESAFSWCESLTSVVIPSSVTRIGKSAFESCESLTSVKFEGSVNDWCSLGIEVDWRVRVKCSDGYVK